MQRRTEVRTTELHLRQGGTSVVLDISGPGLPSMVHWGPDLGELSAAALAGVVLASRAQRTSGAIDEPARLTEHWRAPHPTGLRATTESA